MNASSPFKVLTDRLPEMRAWRRDLHQHPELAFEEHRTAAVIAQRLESFGLTVHRGIGGTGLVTVIDGTGPGLSLGLRADMDALPMQDMSGREYASTIDGCAHACGHDGHTAALLGVAEYLSEHRPRSGRVVLIFQPAEERAAGALAMINDGLLDRFPLDEIYAFHNMPALPAGTAAVLPGTALNGACVWDVEVKGVGGHGAAFYDAIDPVQAAARLTVEISSLVGRYFSPNDSVLITVGTFQAGTAPNIIPGVAKISGTLRARSLTVMNEMKARLSQTCRGVAALTGCEIDLSLPIDVPPCINAPGPSAVAAASCEAILGSGKSLNSMDPLPFTDDFAHMLAAVPGVYFFLGQEGVMCHHPSYDFDDKLLAQAGAIFLDVIERRLGFAANITLAETRLEA
jgi:amidohydrolase